MLVQKFINYLFSMYVGCIMYTPDELICASFENLLSAKNERSNVSYVKIYDYRERVPNLKKEYIEDFQNMLDLYIKGGIKDIEPGTFSGFENLTKFFCDSCSLGGLKTSHFADSNLSSISVVYSNVTDVEPGTFSNLPFADAVSLTYNHIRVIKRGVFENTQFENLYLHTNDIEMIEEGAFSGMNNLKILGLRENKLTTFNSKLLFGQSTDLRILELHKNYLKEINEDFTSPLASLMYLNVGSNLIENIEHGSFKYLKSLRELNLSNNKIKEFNPVINEISKITSLMLAKNQLSYLSEETLEKLVRLNYIALAGNPWQCACRNVLKQYITKRKIRNDCRFPQENFRQNCVAVDKEDCVQDLDKSIDLIKDFKLNTQIEHHC